MTSEELYQALKDGAVLIDAQGRSTMLNTNNQLCNGDGSFRYMSNNYKSNPFLWCQAMINFKVKFTLSYERKTKQELEEFINENE